eukprot:s1525_g10.t1
MPVSKYTELYTAMFGKRLAKAISCSHQVHERIVHHESCFAATDSRTPPSVDDQPEQKRRRLNGKFSPDQIFVPPNNPGDASSEVAAPVPPVRSPEDRLLRISQAIQMAESCAPRVGKQILQAGPLFEFIQQLYPDKTIQVLDICRGVDRLRVCPIGSKGFAPLRRVIGKRRNDLHVFEDSQWEAWEQLSKRQQIRSGTSARIAITVFATNKRSDPEACQSPDSTSPIKKAREADEESSREAASCQPPSNEQLRLDKQISVPFPSTSESTAPVTDNKISTNSHGPLFLQLPQSTQGLVRKLHQNLGHPDNRVLQLALKRYGWKDHEIRACADFTCPVCVEHQQPKIARPGHLRESRDFNDQVSFDAAEWQDSNGKTYRFYHFIDSATNYHVAIPYHQGTTEGLIEAFQNAWLRWAGPPKTVMFDSGTEANSEMFGKFLQENAIKSYVIPTEAHWQLGRAERNGAVLKHMLDKYHQERPISNHDEFNQGLLQLCNAKNAMSRHLGYTPELWVLGKMKPVPGSLSTGHLDSSSYLDCDESTTESSMFQQQLARREAARIAFIRADHSSTLRRALHARSRPERLTFQNGDVVMFWRAGKGVENGSWHGPAKVLMIEDRNLVWVSHLTRLYRCAPEHIRLLSEDEAKSLSDEDRRMFFLPDRSGSGVFQFRELSSQSDPPRNQHAHDPNTNPNAHNANPSPPSNNEPDTVIHNRK